MGARAETIARLQRELAWLDRPAIAASRMPLGHAEADRALKGGLARGALHEVYGGDGRHHAAATGFLVGLLCRLAGDAATVLWVRQDFAVHEAGELSMRGFAELGFDPRRLIVVHVADATMALRITADALACNALGAVVTETCGEARGLDLAASRRLTLVASQSRVTSLMLRLNAQVQPSTAETRWLVRAAPSSPARAWEAWGAPVLDVELVRNRHGASGRFLMTWMCDDAVFKTAGDPPSYSQPAAAAPAYGSHPAARPFRRLASRTG